MREKVILDHQIDATPDDLQKVLGLFTLEHLDYPNVNFKVESENQRQLWVVYRSGVNSLLTNRFVIGYVDMFSLSIHYKSPVKIRIVSCGEEFDILFFMLSQRIQAKFIIIGFPPEAPTIPWKDLAAQEYLKPLTNTIEAAARNRLENPALYMGKYGHYRTISENEVRDVVRQCENYVDNGGSISDFYREALKSSIRQECDLETFRGWVKRFRKSKNKKKKNNPKN